MELFAASRAVARSASVTPRGLNETVSRIWITRSTVRCGRAGMRLTLASATDPFRQRLATRRGSQYGIRVIRISGWISVNTYWSPCRMTATDETQTRSRVGPTISELYELYLRVMRRVGHYRWFSLFMKHLGSRLDRALIRASRGRFSMSGPQLTTMLLTTKGRKSGKDRTVPLHYVRDGKNLVAACENFGLEAASSWPKNLLANPTARIEIGGTAANYLSRPATEGEVTRNVPRLIEMWPAHDSHMERNGVRQVIVFEPLNLSASPGRRK